MKKIALSALVAATLVSAADFNYEITPVAGYVWNSTSNENTTKQFRCYGRRSKPCCCWS